jgi:hypothetical protein
MRSSSCGAKCVTGIDTIPYSPAAAVDGPRCGSEPLLRCSPHIEGAVRGCHLEITVCDNATQPTRAGQADRRWRQFPLRPMNAADRALKASQLRLVDPLGSGCWIPIGRWLSDRAGSASPFLSDQPEPVADILRFRPPVLEARLPARCRAGRLLVKQAAPCFFASRGNLVLRR